MIIPMIDLFSFLLTILLSSVGFAIVVITLVILLDVLFSRPILYENSFMYQILTYLGIVWVPKDIHLVLAFIFFSLLAFGLLLSFGNNRKRVVLLAESILTKTPTPTVYPLPAISITPTFDLDEFTSTNTEYPPTLKPTLTPSRRPTETKVKPTSSPRPSYTPTNISLNKPQSANVPGDLIAFQSDKNGNFDIWVINWKTGELTQMTDSLADETVPSWSPTGKQIAYQSFLDTNWEIYTVKLTNKKQQKITSNRCADWAPNWSPDGADFVFYSDCDGNREIYVIDGDGGTRKQLTFTSGKNIYNWFPAWSPNGKQIIFASNYSGGKYYVYVMNANGSNQRKLSQGCIPSFSPDEKKILFSQYCKDSGDILIMNADGSNVKTLIRGNFRNPSWSSDGEKIVFQAGDNDLFEIWIMDADGSNAYQLTNIGGNNGAPVWQPRNP